MSLTAAFPLLLLNGVASLSPFASSTRRQQNTYTDKERGEKKGKGLKKRKEMVSWCLKIGAFAQTRSHLDVLPEQSLTFTQFHCSPR